MATRNQESSALKVEPPHYSESGSFEEQLARDDRASAQLAGSGTFLDNGWDRWHYLVDEDNGIPGRVVIQLQVGPLITWWKRIEIQSLLFGNWWGLRRLGTSNDTRIATTDITPAAARSDVLRLEFWKAGFLNSGSYLHTEVISVSAHLGKVLVFLCDRDGPGQP
jgi:hypothetical protein